MVVAHSFSLICEQTNDRSQIILMRVSHIMHSLLTNEQSQQFVGLLRITVSVIHSERHGKEVSIGVVGVMRVAMRLAGHEALRVGHWRELARAVGNKRLSALHARGRRGLLVRTGSTNRVNENIQMDSLHLVQLQLQFQPLPLLRSKD